jgi:hypothetical protein
MGRINSMMSIDPAISEAARLVTINGTASEIEL